MPKPLTRREQQVLELRSHGKNVAQIAAEMGISVPTTKTHQRRVVEKLGAKSAPHAVRLGFEAGLLAGDAR